MTVAKCSCILGTVLVIAGLGGSLALPSAAQDPPPVKIRVEKGIKVRVETEPYEPYKHLLPTGKVIEQYKERLKRNPKDLQACTMLAGLYIRRARETGGVEAVAGPAPDPGRAERLAILDEEIGRLPERQRAAIVLCDLERLPHEEAARRLGCPVGTVESRLSRARQRLRDHRSPVAPASSDHSAAAS